MKRYRRGGVKLQHTTLPGVRAALEDIGRWPEVQTCIPGRIRRCHTRHGPLLTVQASIPTGLKLAAHAGDAIQEIFVVTADPDRCRRAYR